jgi:protein-disulfide isomerase
MQEPTLTTILHEEKKIEGKIEEVKNLITDTQEHTSVPPKKHNKGLSTSTAIIIGALLISFSHIGYGILMSDAQSNGTAKSELFKGRPIDATDLATGKTNSDVIVVEYSDTECPFCAQLHPTMKKLQEQYGSKVSFVYRYFPLTQIHPDAFDEARAVYCVGKIGGAQKRMDYINEMFTYKIGKQNMVLPKGGRESLAKNIGIDGKAFDSCMQSSEPGDAVNASTQDGITAGVEGTPATFILTKTRKGYEVVSLVSGARPYEYFKATVEEALAK